MAEAAKKEEVKLTDDQAWERVQKDRAATQAADAVAEPATVKTDGKETVRADPADPYAGLPEPTRKLLEGLDTRLKENEGRFKDVNKKLATAHGTIGNLKQRLDASQVELTRIAPTLEAVEAEKARVEKAAADAKVAKRKALRERLSDLPDVAELMDEVLPADAEPAVKVEPKAEPKKEPEKEVADLPADREARLIRERELSDLHPGWIAMVNTPEWKTWEAAQPEAVRALGASDAVADADQMFKIFKKHKSDAAQVAEVEKDRAERLRRGEGVQGRGSSAQDVDTGPDALWNKVKRDREKARETG